MKKATHPQFPHREPAEQEAAAVITKRLAAMTHAELLAYVQRILVRRARAGPLDQRRLP